MIRKRAAAMAALGSLAAAVPALAQDSGWGMIGQRQVGIDVDHDSIPARAGEQYRQLMLCVERAPIQVLDVTVRYRNGANQSVRMRSRIADGRCSRGIDLRGREREVASVDFTYQTASLGGQRALVQLFAR